MHATNVCIFHHAMSTKLMKWITCFCIVFAISQWCLYCHWSTCQCGVCSSLLNNTYLKCVIEPSTEQLWVIICQPHPYRIGNQGERDSVRLFGPPPCLLHLSCNTHPGLHTEGIKAVPHYITIQFGINTERKGSIILWQQQKYICSYSYEEDQSQWCDVN